MATRPCLDCDKLTQRHDSRCAKCAGRWHRNRDARRGNTTQREYGSTWAALSKTVITRDRGICHWCGNAATTTDHVTPKTLGGTDHPNNLVAACTSCNSARTANIGRNGQTG